VQTVPAGAFVYLNFPVAPLPGSYEDPVTLNLQARRTAGAGTIGAAGTFAIGIQT
jgi:hypothetical protein